MPKAKLVNFKTGKMGQIEVPQSFFEVEGDPDVVYQAVRYYLQKQRAGLASTKTRSEVRGGGRKPWRQKGTGRARHGSIRSPLWVGGGITFGPQPRSFRTKMPAKMRTKALFMILSDKLAEDRLLFYKNLTFSNPKTKDAVEALSILPSYKKLLIVNGQKDENISLSLRNLQGVKFQVCPGLNVYEILKHDLILLNKDVLAFMEKSYLEGNN